MISMFAFVPAPHFSFTGPVDEHGGGEPWQFVPIAIIADYRDQAKEGPSGGGPPRR